MSDGYDYSLKIKLFNILIKYCNMVVYKNIICI